MKLATVGYQTEKKELVDIYDIFFTAKKTAIKSVDDREFEIFTLLNQSTYSVSSNQIAD